ncbi:MAG TPA: undecaprenyl-diphosphate phosphatase [Steroidobacteraceae bacterium]|nr:undecaprenyl-diphosphate phosphatase [Steroidobacteraceae bacterium]
MSLLNIIILGIVQGLAELLPVSSSAHVVVAEKLMGLDPSSPPMTLLLAMLHTGTMFAVIAYFWRPWRRTYFHSLPAFKKFAGAVILATVLTGIVGEGLYVLIEHTLFRGRPHAQIEDLFGRLDLIAPALAAAGVLIVVAGLIERRRGAQSADLDTRQAGIIGAIQGLTLPFRGFSRSGATISTGMLLGVAKARAEIFSFALAVVLTPPLVAREALRLYRAPVDAGADLGAIVARTVFGALIAFFAGLLALKWLSGWLERGRWHLFGIYCLAAAVVVALLHHAGY